MGLLEGTLAAWTAYKLVTESSAGPKIRKGIKNARKVSGSAGDKFSCFSGNHQLPDDADTEYGGTFRCVRCDASVKVKGR